jgi:hypothetical protein
MYRVLVKLSTSKISYVMAVMSALTTENKFPGALEAWQILAVREESQ